MPAPGGGWPGILARGRVTFTVNGKLFSIAALPASAWISAIYSADPEDIVPGLLPESQQEAWGDVVWSTERPFTPELHTRINHACVGAAAGMPWSGALKVLASAASLWYELDGRAAERGADLLDLPLHRLCALVYHRMVTGADDKDRFRIDADLFAPPPDADPEDPDAAPPGWSDEEAAATFQAALASHTASPATQ